jgi:hypothetical protein
VVAGEVSGGTGDLLGVPLPVQAVFDAWVARVTPAGVAVHVLQPTVGPAEERFLEVRPIGAAGEYIVGGLYDGDVTFGGTTLSGGSFGYMMARINNVGAPVWVGGNDGGNTVVGLRRFAIDGGGNIRVAGNMPGGTAQYFGLVVPAVNTNCRMLTIDGASGLAIKQDAFAVTGGIGATCNTAVALTPTGSAIIGRLFGVSGSFDEVPVLGVGADDQLLIRLRL